MNRSAAARPFSSLRKPGAVLVFGAILACSLSTPPYSKLPHDTQARLNLAQDLSPDGAQEESLSDTVLTLGIEHRNLLCAAGITSESASNLETCEFLLQAWADHIKNETERHMYRFRNNPAEFGHSEGYFRMLLMAVVLAEDYHIHYDLQKVTATTSAAQTDGFFRNPNLVFLPGLLGPERKGTCASMPVLYIAIGRKLGYPLSLVATKGHLFCRWEGDVDRFNIEATAPGLSRFDDDYYRHWPFELSPKEEKANGYLLSLTPRQELAVFLSIRAMCLRDAGRLAEAAGCFLRASRIDPSCQEYVSLATRLREGNVAN